MTVISTVDEMAWEDEPRIVGCFFCCQLLTLPALHWLGAQGHIYLDRNCFDTLFIRLAVDAHVIDRRGRLI